MTEEERSPEAITRSARYALAHPVRHAIGIFFLALPLMLVYVRERRLTMLLLALTLGLVGAALDLWLFRRPNGFMRRSALRRLGQPTGSEKTHRWEGRI